MVYNGLHSCSQVWKGKCGAYHVHRGLVLSQGLYKSTIVVPAWRLDLFLTSNSNAVFRMHATGKFVATDYYTTLKVILLGITEVHSAGGFHCTLCLNGIFFDVKVQCPINVIIGVTNGKQFFLCTV